MIDTRRWVLAEAWLSLGLRVEWVGTWEASRIERADWQDDPDSRARYLYDGLGVWKVERGDRRRAETETTVPDLSLATMKHELAHYLVSTEEERGKRNFGIPSAATSSDNEDRALAAEKVIDALTSACGRIAASALLSPARAR